MSQILKALSPTEVGGLRPDPESALVPATSSVPALFCAEMEVEPASKGEEGQEEEGPGPATVKEEGVHLENGEPPEENEESAGTDSGHELGMEGQNLRSGTYGDRTESKAYGSIIHKCEVRGPWAVPALCLRGLCSP